MNDKKMGRPEVKDPRNNSIIFTCSLADKQKIKDEAVKKNMTVSDFVLNCIKQFI